VRTRKTLEAARNAYLDLVWVENSSTNSQALLDGVADGTIDYTIADSTNSPWRMTVHPDCRIAC